MIYMKPKYYHYKRNKWVEQIIIVKSGRVGKVLYIKWSDDINFEKWRPQGKEVMSMPFYNSRKECKRITKKQLEELLFIDCL